MKFKIEYILIALSLILLLNSCDNEKNKILITYKPIKFDSLELYNPFKIDLKQNSSNLKFHIISYINVSCSVCIAEIDKCN